MKLLLAVAGLLTTSLGACAQQPDELAELRKVEKPEAVVPSRVYTYVEQMPQLPGGGGQAAIAMELMKRARFPAVDLREQFNSHVLLYMEINPSGTIQHVKLLHTTGSATVDGIFVAAAKSLPRFTPGRQNRQPVTVSLTMPITFCLK